MTLPITGVSSLFNTQTIYFKLAVCFIHNIPVWLERAEEQFGRLQRAWRCHLQALAAALLWVPPASHVPIFSRCSPGHVMEEAVQQAPRPRGVAQHPAERRARAEPAPRACGCGDEDLELGARVRVSGLRAALGNAWTRPEPRASSGRGGDPGEAGTLCPGSRNGEREAGARRRPPHPHSHPQPACAGCKLRRRGVANRPELRSGCYR